MGPEKAGRLMSPGSYCSEICRAEQLLALELGVRLIPVLAVALKGSDRPLYLYAIATSPYATRLGELLGRQVVLQVGAPRRVLAHPGTRMNLGRFGRWPSCRRSYRCVNKKGNTGSQSTVFPEYFRLAAHSKSYGVSSTVFMGDALSSVKSQPSILANPASSTPA